MAVIRKQVTINSLSYIVFFKAYCDIDQVGVEC